MKRKKAFSLFLALMMILPLAAFAESGSETYRLEGLVTGLVDGGFLMEDRELGEVLLNVDDMTVLDGILAQGEIEVGQYVIVDYDGRLTRSIPPQAHADRVGCYVLSGTVTELYESGVLLSGDPLFGDVIVHLDAAAQHVYMGMPLTVYYDGVMAMSLPGQANALYTIVPELSGMVSERDDEGFTLTGADGESYRVLLGEETLVGVLSASYEEAAAGEDGGAAATDAAGNEAGEPETADGNVDGGAAATDAAGNKAEEPETADGNVEMADADGEEPDVDSAEPLTEGPDIQLPAFTPEWGDGDNVIVYYDGSMTKSLPPQLHAMEILVIR